MNVRIFHCALILRFIFPLFLYLRRFFIFSPSAFFFSFVDPLFSILFSRWFRTSRIYWSGKILADVIQSSRWKFRDSRFQHNLQTALQCVTSTGRNSIQTILAPARLSDTEDFFLANSCGHREPFRFVQCSIMPCRWSRRNWQIRSMSRIVNNRFDYIC